jgi:UDP-N-acetyl-D-glucosamine dehydrogenase
MIINRETDMGSTNDSDAIAARFMKAIDTRTAVAGVIGLGYVGLPLAVEIGRSGYRTIGFEISETVAAAVNAGTSHIQDVSSDVVEGLVRQKRLLATTDMSMMAQCDVISICVPTPLSKTKDPDLSFILSAAALVARHLRAGQLVILESTTFPGTTRDVLLPLLEEGGLKAGRDFFVCFSPERVDPGNPVWGTKNTPKVLGGITNACMQIGFAFYSKIFDHMVPVESAEAAELVKVYENTFRMINIALVNELAQVCDKLGVDVWNVIDAAATKPFGFMKFTPGPGLGGHCIPLDPHYLSWKMRTLHFKTRMIDLASDINSEMPQFVVRKANDVLNERGKALHGARVLVLGIAYKKDIDDLRESPALEVIHLLQEKGADVAYHDPHCSVILDDGYTELDHLPLHSAPLTNDVLEAADLVIIATEHTDVDYQRVADHAELILDTRGAMRRVTGKARIISLSGAVADPGERARRPHGWATVAAAT